MLIVLVFLFLITVPKQPCKESRYTYNHYKYNNTDKYLHSYLQYIICLLCFLFFCVSHVRKTIVAGNPIIKINNVMIPNISYIKVLSKFLVLQYVNQIRRVSLQNSSFEISLYQFLTVCKYHQAIHSRSALLLLFQQNKSHVCMPLLQQFLQNVAT